MAHFEVANLQGEHFGPVSFALQGGECMAVSGPSGAGKTQLLRALADLDPHQGEVLLEGRRQCDLAATAWRRRVALLPAQPQWWAETVAEHFPGRPPENWLALLGLDAALLDRQVTRLSEGEQQRLALLRLLCNEPRVLLMDEPSGRLDPDNVTRLERFVEEYRQRTGAAVVWVTHDPMQARRVATRHVHMAGGSMEEVQ